MIPPVLDRQRGLGPEWAAWLDRLPRLRADLLEEWALAPDGDPWHGHCSLVLPVRTDDGRAAALKIGLPDEESEQEALALQHWHGHGAVRLLRADPRRRAMLLERLLPTDLGDAWDLEACEVVGGLYGRLHVPAPPRLRRLDDVVGPWTEALAGLPREAPVPRRLVEQALAHSRDLLADPGPARLLHTDLHYGNVLAAPHDGAGGDADDAGRGDWLVIDPKPLAGDPHYEPGPLLWNRWEELTGDVPGGVRGALRRRFHAVVDAAGLDEERARAWVLVRMVHQVLFVLRRADGTAPGTQQGLGPGDREWLTRCVTGAKALSD